MLELVRNTHLGTFLDMELVQISIKKSSESEIRWICWMLFPPLRRVKPSAWASGASSGCSLCSSSQTTRKRKAKRRRRRRSSHRWLQQGAAKTNKPLQTVGDPKLWDLSDHLLADWSVWKTGNRTEHLIRDCPRYFEEDVWTLDISTD